MIVLSHTQRAAIASHAVEAHPEECCGLMLGTFSDEGRKVVRELLPISNAREAEARHNRFLIGPMEMLRGELEARARGLDIVGIYHSHPDCDAYFSKTDLENSSPWHSFVVLSIQNGKFDHAACFRPDLDRTSAEKEELIYPWQKS